jgi:hypothetical protein
MLSNVVQHAYLVYLVNVGVLCHEAQLLGEVVSVLDGSNGLTK